MGFCEGFGRAEEWHEIKGKHFVVFYRQDEDKTAARKVLRKAEGYYKKIGAQIGYTRYSQFWTWDERVKIILFHDQQTFMKETGHPNWLLGYSSRDEQVLKSKVIVTYKQEANFFTGFLPHEISHLILGDFLHPRLVPLWFDEGVAQLQEVNKSAMTDSMMRVLVRKGQTIPFEQLTCVTDIRLEKDPNKVMIFYSQSLSVVEFLIKRYGINAFRQLCRNLKDVSFEKALKKAYLNQLMSIADLERQWIKYMGD